MGFKMHCECPLEKKLEIDLLHQDKEAFLDKNKNKNNLSTPSL
jgi:hypothetical protein